MIDMADNKITLSKSDRFMVCLRSTFWQASWNYERMQNGGYAFAMIPAIKKLYKEKADQIAALKRHMEFFNTHPYVASPIVGVTLALEQEKANGAAVDDAAIQGVKVGMMGPLAGIGDPVFWFTLRPILGAMCASIAMDGNMLGPIMFFLLWNILRFGFMWYTQEFGYKVGSQITENLSGNLLTNITRGASILGMFVLGALVQRWVSIKFAPVVSSIQLSKGAYIEWDQLPAGGEGTEGPLAAEHFDADALPELLAGEELHKAHLTAGHHMGTAAGAAVRTGEGHDADITFQLLLAAVFHRGQLCAPVELDVDGVVFIDIAVGLGFNFHQLVPADLGVEVDGHHVGAHVKAHIVAVEVLADHAAADVLAGVLLHVVEASRPVDGAHYSLPDLHFLFTGVENDPALFVDIRHGDAVHLSVVGRLSAALGIEGGAVQHHFEAAFGLLAGEDRGCEFFQKRVLII